MNKRNINEEIENIKNNQIEILDLKSTITVMKNWVEGVKVLCEQTEQQISKVEDRTMEIIQSEEQIEEKWTEPKGSVGHHQVV